MSKYFLLQYLKNPKRWTELARQGTFAFSASIVAKHQKIERRPFGEKHSKKSLTMPKKLKGGPFEIFQHPVENILKLLTRILPFPESLGKNLDKILTKSARNMYDLARSCQELQEKCLIFSTEKTHKKGF